jgi:hypothetical protein
MTFSWDKIPKLGLLLSENFGHAYFPQNQICLEHAKGISYSPQKYFSKGVLHALIKNDLTLVVRGFVVRSQIPNLTLGPSLDHNSFISCINEQCEGILSI